ADTNDQDNRRTVSERKSRPGIRERRPRSTASFARIPDQATTLEACELGRIFASFCRRALLVAYCTFLSARPTLHDAVDDRSFAGWEFFRIDRRCAIRAAPREDEEGKQTDRSEGFQRCQNSGIVESIPTLARSSGRL